MHSSTMDPAQISDILLTKIKKSNLNFNLSETPFAVSINIKKSFIRDKNGAPIYPSAGFSESQNFALEENKALKIAIAQYQSEQEALEHATHNLSLKLEKAKVEIEDIMLEKNQLKEANKIKKDEVTDLKAFSNSLKVESEKLKKELDSFLKVVKTKDKEINSLNTKNENLSENVAKAKKENSILREEKNKAVKEIKLLQNKKSARISTKSTNTFSTSRSNVSTNTPGISLTNVPTNLQPLVNLADVDLSQNQLTKVDHYLSSFFK